MVQFTADFGGETDGNPPAGFTERWVTTNTDWAIFSGADLSAGKGVVYTQTAANLYRLLSYDAASAEDVEVLMRFKYSSVPDVYHSGIAAVRGSGAAGAEYGYALSLHDGQFRVFKFDNGGSSVIAGVNYPVRASGAQWLYARYRIDGTSIKAKIWGQDEVEPGFWYLDFTDASISGSGWVGFHPAGGITEGDIEYDFIVVAIDGATATYDDLPTDGDIETTTVDYEVLVSFPAEGIEATTAFYTPVILEPQPMEATVAHYDVVCLGEVELPYVLAWTATLDDHDFYFLQLQEITLVYDFHSEKWYNWGSGSRELWRGQIGLDWNANISAIQTMIGGTRISNILVGDSTTGALYILDPEGSEDDDPTGTSKIAFQRLVYGQWPVRGINYVPCAGVQITGSIGEVTTATDMDVTLKLSDNSGHTFYDAGSYALAVGDYSYSLHWRSLGSFRGPGRIFRIEDWGALVRIDSFDMDDAS